MPHFVLLTIKPFEIFILLSYWQGRAGENCIACHENISSLIFCGLTHQLFKSCISPVSGSRTQTIKTCIRATFSDILLHILLRDGRLGERWLKVWHQLSTYMNRRGFPRTRYSGNHCSGRASQLRTGAHILATGIPEVRHHLISSGSRETPMHPCCPHSVASEWLDPGLMVSLFLGGFGSNSCWL